jgi:hypothetical protein
MLLGHFVLLLLWRVVYNFIEFSKFLQNFDMPTIDND